MTSSLRPGNLLRAAFVLGVTSGSVNSLGPTDLVGRYTLARVNEAPPPQVVGATISCDLLLTGGRLELRTSDWSALTLDQRQDCRRVGGPTSVTSLLYLGTFHVTGSTLTFETLRSIDDTLRFAGQIALGGVTLSVSDVVRGLPGPIALQFGPRQPL